MQQGATDDTLRQPLHAGVAIPADETDSASKKRGTSVSVAAFVLLNTILGAGILGLPGAYALSGFAAGTVLLGMSGLFATFGVHLLTEVADRTGRPATFYSIARAAAGESAGSLIDLLVVVMAFGISTSYLIVIGDTLPKVMIALHAPEGSLLLGRTPWMLCMLAVAAPLTFLRDISALRYTAYAAFVCSLYIAAVVVLFFADPAEFPSDGSRGDVAFVTDAPQMLRGLPIFVFGFTCHQNAVSVTNGLERPTASRSVVAAGSAVATGFCLYTLVGVLGYATFGQGVDSDILNSYPQAAVLPTIGRVAIACVVTTCYPMQVHPGRGCLLSLVAKLAPPSFLKRVGGADGLPLYIVATSLFLAASISLALAVTSLGKMLTIIGAVCSTSVQYIMPGGCYYVLFPEGNPTKRFLALALFLLGLVIMPLCVVLTFVSV